MACRPRLRFARPQQSLPAVRPSGLAPWACCAAVGSPCICFCASCEDVATSPAARFIVLVGGCSLASAAMPVVVWPVPTDAGPEPASFRFAARPVVSQGPAIAVLALKITMEQAARMICFVFICTSYAPDERPSASGRIGNCSSGHGFRVARPISVLFSQALMFPPTQDQSFTNGPRPSVCPHVPTGYFSIRRRRVARNRTRNRSGSRKRCRDRWGSIDPI
jgi:hypothetical protein